MRKIKRFLIWLFNLEDADIKINSGTQHLPIHSGVGYILWSVDHFVYRAKHLAFNMYDEPKSNWKKVFNESKFKEALQRMLADHDRDHGISYMDVDSYLIAYCKR